MHHIKYSHTPALHISTEGPYDTMPSPRQTTKELKRKLSRTNTNVKIDNQTEGRQVVKKRRNLPEFQGRRNNSIHNWSLRRLQKKYGNISTRNLHTHELPSPVNFAKPKSTIFTSLSRSARLNTRFSGFRSLVKS
jgi:hypothetical protein